MSDTLKISHVAKRGFSVSQNVVSGAVPLALFPLRQSKRWRVKVTAAVRLRDQLMISART
jgi:hypothetical protein